MKVIAYLITFLLFLSISGGNTILASSESAYKDYLFQYDQYRLKLNNFHVARTEYLTYKTLLAETTALDTARAMMVQRDDLLRSYILLLNEKINENNGMSDTDRKLYQTIIKNESSYIQTHKTHMTSVGSLSDAEKISIDLQTHYPILNTSVHQILIALSLADLSRMNKQFVSLQEIFRSSIQSNRSYLTPEKQTISDRWMIQISNKQNLYQQKV